MKLLLVEDHLYVAESLQLLLERTIDFSVATDCSQAIKLVTEEEKFDIVLLDMGLPDSDGQSLLQFFQHHNYFPPVLVITGKENESEIVKITRSLGAKGYYHKSQSPKILLQAIDILLDGGEYWPVNIAPEALSADEKRTNMARHFGITPRQMEVLGFLDDGLQNKQIAEVMNISEGTVKSHIKALYIALGARTRSGCVKTARQLGLLVE